MAPPSRDDLMTLAERALGHASGEAQATAWWERQLSAGPGRAVTTDAVSVEVVVVSGGRVGTAVTTEADGLERVAGAAARLAASGPAARGDLPDPAAGREHDGYDLSVDTLEPPDELDEWTGWRAAAARTAIASSRGVRAYEQRSFGDLRVRRHGAPGRSLELTEASVRPAELDPAALASEADALLGDGPQIEVDPGEYPVVLGPWAVAEVLRRAALAFGGPGSPLADHVGKRVAAPCINLSDSPRFAATLPRSFDAEGAPRQPLPLIQDGVAHRLATPGTGHALTAGGIGGTAPEHLVLVGGGAADLAELAEPIATGLLIPALSLHGAWVLGRRGAALAEGVSIIRDGRVAGVAENLTVMFEPIELLGRAQALTARQRTVPPPVQRSARTATAVVCPGVRFVGGVFVT